MSSLVTSIGAGGQAKQLPPLTAWLPGCLAGKGKGGPGVFLQTPSSHSADSSACINPKTSTRFALNSAR